MFSPSRRPTNHHNSTSTPQKAAKARSDCPAKKFWESLKATCRGGRTRAILPSTDNASPHGYTFHRIDWDSKVHTLLSNTFTEDLKARRDQTSPGSQCR